MRIKWKGIAFGAILGLILGIIGFGAGTWQFWLAVIVINAAHVFLGEK